MCGKENIQSVVENALCTACGACSGICPTGAISMDVNTAGYLIASLEAKKCIHCGICHEICPSVDENTPEPGTVDIFHGNYLEGYVGHASDKGIRQKSQSGGIVTALMCHLLEQGEIDGAIVNCFDPITRRSISVLAETIEVIKKGCGSFYSQSSVVKTILDNRAKKTAAVVLGCQAESLNLIRKKFSNIQLPKYMIGLFCAGNYSGSYIDDLISHSGCSESEISNFRFRDKNAGGWPGDVKVTTAGEDCILDKGSRHLLKPVYESFRCLLCFDQTNIFSDIAVGDPWGIANQMDKLGNTVVIARTKKGKDLIESAAKAGVIEVEQLPVMEIIEGQTVDGRLKTQFFTSIDLCKKKGLMLPFKTGNFSPIFYNKPLERRKREIERRLDFSRDIYLEKDFGNYRQKLLAKKDELRRQRILNRLNLPKRVLGFCLRKAKSFWLK